MGAANFESSVLNSLPGGPAGGQPLRGERIQLTPYLILACSLLYMMASDGELEAQESSHLQGVLGGDEAVLSYGLRYVRQVPIEQFYTAARELLSTKDKWCILVNVCDAMLSDGRADKDELRLLADMAKAFGLNQAQFEPFLKVLTIKHDKSVLGAYKGVKSERQAMTPHFALAITMLYMLTSDGSIGQQEIGQLEAVIGEFEGLQHAALTYVRTVKLKDFLAEATAVLNVDQKLYVLVNVSDCMLADGEVAQLEDKLFFSILTAFGYNDKSFERYRNVIETKNIKPFDTSDFKNKVVHDRVLSEGDEEGVAFTHEISGADHQTVLVDADGDVAMRDFISRTMQDNIQSVDDDFGDQANVVKVALNATDSLNVQQITESAAAKNNQILNTAGAPENVQQLDVETSNAHRERLGQDPTSQNIQTLAADDKAQNLQQIATDGDSLHREKLEPEQRLQNIQEVVGEVNDRLNYFESKNLGFLSIGRKQKFNDSFEPIDISSTPTNRQKVSDFFKRKEGAVSSDAPAQWRAVSSEAPGSQDAVSILASQAPVQSSVLKSGLSRGLHLYKGNANLTGRVRRIAYVQLGVAAALLVFAAPVNTQQAIGKTFSGPLLLTTASYSP